MIDAKKIFAEAAAKAAANGPDHVLAEFFDWLKEADAIADAPFDALRGWASDLIGVGADAMDRDRFVNAACERWPKHVGKRSLTSVWTKLAREPYNDDGDHADDDDRPPITEQLEPWETPVSGLELAAEVQRNLTRFVVFDSPDVDADAIALWIMSSYLMDAWAIFPKLIVTSPTKRCGKTTLLQIIASMALESLVSVDQSKAVFFRICEVSKPTLILDEADQFLTSDTVLAGVINAGHTRRTAFVQRIDLTDDRLLPYNFSVWFPQVFGGIGRKWIKDTWADRSLIVQLTRKRTSQSIVRHTIHTHDQLEPLRRKLIRWADDVITEMQSTAVDDPDPLTGRGENDRAQDNWAPAYHVAQALGGDWPVRCLAAFDHYAARVDGRDIEETIQLLTDLEELLSTDKAKRDGIVNTSSLIGDLNRIETSPWGEYRNGQGVTPQWVAKTLVDFNVRPQQMRVRGNKLRGYIPAEITAALDHYRPAK